ncbi:MAG: hypothetical protein QOD30_2157, partial [Actinomycetota bacterium]|nr:hypothetical protein [Actinomycetota bacterium]
VLRSLELLQRAGAVVRRAGAVELIGRPAEGIGGLQLADFLDDVRAVRGDATVDWSIGEVLEPDLVEVVPHRSRWRSRTGAALAVVAAAVVLALAPSQPISTSTSTASGPQHRGVPTTSSDALSAIGANTSVTSAAPDAARTVEVTEPRHADRRTTTDIAPQPVPSDEDAIAASCATGAPAVELINGLLLLSNSWTTDVVVTELLVDGTTMTTAITIPAGKRVEQLLSPSAHDVSIAQWSWADDGTVPRCGS